MPSYNFSILALILFFVVIFTIGIFSTGKIKDIREYVFGNEATLTSLSVALTTILSELNQDYIFGFLGDLINSSQACVLTYLGITLSYALRAIFIAPYMKKYLNCLTAGDILKISYGERAKTLYGIISLIYGIAFAFMQFCAIGIIIEVFWGINYQYSILLVGLLLIPYSSLGGMKAISSMHIFYFTLIVLVLFIVGSIGIMKIRGIEESMSALSMIHSPTGSKSQIFLWATFLIKSVFLVDFSSPAKFQSFLYNCGKRKLIRSFLYTSLIHSLIILLLFFIGLPFITSSLNVTTIQKLMLTLSSKMASTEMKLLVGLGLSSMCAASLNSNLHSVGVVIANDLIGTTQQSRKFSVLLFAKMGTMIIGVVSLCLAAIFPHTCKIDFILSLNLITISLPLLFCIWGYKSSNKVFWFSLTLGLVCSMFASMYFEQYNNLEHIIVGIFVSNLVFLASLFLNYRNLIFSNIKDLKLNGTHKIKLIMKSIINVIYLTIQNSLDLTKSYSYKTIADYKGFAIFYLLMQIFQYFFIGFGIYSQVYLVLELKLLSVIMCVFLIFLQKIPFRHQKKIHICIYIILTYCLVFLPFTTFAISGGNMYYALDCAICTMILVYIVEWEKFFIILFIGIAASNYVVKKILFYNLYIINKEALSANIYILMIAIFVAIIFSRKKQKTLDLLAYKAKFMELIEKQKNKELIIVESAQYKIINQLISGQVSFTERLHSIRDKIIEKQKFEEASSEIDLLIGYFNSIFNEAINYYKLEVEELSIDSLIEEMKYFIDIDIFQKVNIINDSKHKSIFCDHIGFLRIVNVLIEELINDIHKLNLSYIEDLYIVIKDSEIKYHLVELPEYEKKISAIRFIITTEYNENNSPEITEPSSVELTNPESVLPVSFADLSQYANSRAIQATYADFSSMTDDYNICKLYTFPVNVYHIRPYVLDLNPENQINLWDEASLEMENKFLQELKKSQLEESFKQITDAMDLIKKYYPTYDFAEENISLYINAMELAKISLKIINDRDSNIYLYISNYKTELVVTCLMHKILRKTSLHPIILKSKFGNIVTKSIFELTNFHEKYVNCKEEERSLGHDFSHLSLMSKCVLICSRLYILYNINHISNINKKAEIAQNTLCSYIRLAMVLGLYDIAREMEDISKKILNDLNIKFKNFE